MYKIVQGFMVTCSRWCTWQSIVFPGRNCQPLITLKYCLLVELQRLTHIQFRAHPERIIFLVYCISALWGETGLPFTDTSIQLTWNENLSIVAVCRETLEFVIIYAQPFWFLYIPFFNRTNFLKELHNRNDVKVALLRLQLGQSVAVAEPSKSV